MMGIKTIEYNGRQIEMPEDATDAEVSQILDQYDKVNRGSNFQQYKPSEPSSLAKLFIKWAPEWAAEEAKKVATGGYLPELIDLAGGATATMRGALNMVSPGAGNQAFPTSGFTTGADVNPNSGMYIAGNVIDPVANAIGLATGGAVSAVPALTKGYKIAQTIPKTLPLTAEALARAGVTGSVTGAGTAYLGSEGNLQDTGTAGLYGGLFGVAAPVAGRAAKSGIGYVQDWVGGNLGKVQAANIARAAAGDQLPAIRTALQNAPSNVTAGQATVSANKPTFSALSELGSTRDTSGHYYNLGQQQEQQRMGMLTGVTPELSFEEGARNAKFKANFANASEVANLRRLSREASVMPPKPTVELKPSNVQPGMKIETRTAGNIPENFPGISAVEALKSNKGIQAAMADARRMAANRAGLPEELTILTDAQLRDIIKDPTKSLEGLQLMKKAIDNRFTNPERLDTALAKLADADVTITKKALTSAIDQAIPEYGNARKVFAQDSGPVNQSLLLTQLKDTLKNSAGGTERVTPFTNALGRGEESALTKSGINTRFGGISEVLTPTQMTTVNEVRDQLLRDEALKLQIEAGKGGLQQIMAEQSSRFRLPNMMNQKAALANKFLEVAEKYLSKDSIKAISEGMKSGRSALELLDTLPAQDRNKWALWLNQAGQTAGKYGVPGAVVGSTIQGQKEQ